MDGLIFDRSRDTPSLERLRTGTTFVWNNTLEWNGIILRTSVNLLIIVLRSTCSMEKLSVNIEC